MDAQGLRLGASYGLAGAGDCIGSAWTDTHPTAGAATPGPEVSVREDDG